MGVKFCGDKVEAPLFRECWPLRNLIPDPTMKTGWGGTSSGSPTYKSGCNSITLTGTASTPEVCLSTTGSIPLDKTHIYYARVYGLQSTACGSAGFYWPIAEPSLTDGIPIKAAGSWQMYSVRNHRQTFSNGSYPFRLDFNNAYQAGSISYSCPMLLDLTEAFGAGLEPSQAWCDGNIPFFTGYYEMVPGPAMSISAAGLMAKELREFSLPNIVVHGGFEAADGWSGVTRDTAKKLSGAYSSKLGKTTGTVINTRPAVKPVAGHVYYGRHSFMTDGDPQPTDCRFEWFAGDGAGLNFVFGWNQGSHPDWFTESARLTVTAVNGTSYIIRNFAVAPKANIWCDNLMIVDLTAGFGAGKEPSKEWCDRNLAFTDGEITVKNSAKLTAGYFQTPELREI